MAITGKTLAQIDTAYVAAAKLAKMLEDYHQGTNVPGTQSGRVPVADIDTQLTATATAIGVLTATE